MRIKEALIMDLREAVSVRETCGGLALMHGKLTATALCLLEDGRCMRLHLPLAALPAAITEALATYAAALVGREVPSAYVVEEPQEKPSHVPTIDLEI